MRVRASLLPTMPPPGGFLLPGALMTDIYRITVTTKSGETHQGLMTRSQPEVVNGFIAIAKEYASWVYLAPDDVLKMEYVPEAAEEKTE